MNTHLTNLFAKQPVRVYKLTVAPVENELYRKAHNKQYYERTKEKRKEQREQKNRK